MMRPEELEKLKDWELELQLVLTERLIDALGKHAQKFKVGADINKLRTYRGQLRAEIAKRHPYGGFS